MQKGTGTFFQFLRQIITIAKTPRIARASLFTALVVGSILNIVNQGGALIKGQPLSVGHLLMNFFVPFCVSSYSAARNELTRKASDIAQPRHKQGEPLRVENH